MKLEWPLTFPPAVVGQPFGVNPDLYAKFGLQGHDGQDLPTPIGTPVKACHDGFIGGVNENDRSYGLYLTQHWIEDGVIYELLYGHFDNVNFSNRGESVLDNSIAVKAGDIIGISGNTGNSTGPHLHLGLRTYNLQGQILNYNNGFHGCIDPMPFLRKVENMNSYVQTLNLDGTVGAFIPLSDKSQIDLLNKIFDLGIQVEADGSIPTQITATKK